VFPAAVSSQSGAAARQRGRPVLPARTKQYQIRLRACDFIESGFTPVNRDGIVTSLIQQCTDDFGGLLVVFDNQYLAVGVA
jgi:hypothetical protein